MKRWLKTELHSHTLEDPIDGGSIIRHSPRKLLEAAAEQGFEALAITNHNQMLFDNRLKRMAEDLGILLIPGVEATVGGRHILLYNFLGYESGWQDPQDIRRHKGPEQLVIAPHPFFPARSALRRDFYRWQDLFDAIEINHFYHRLIDFNRKAHLEAARLGLPLIGNSDVHHLFQLGCSYSLIYAEKNVASVLQAIRRREVRLVSRPVSAAFIARWFILNACYRLHFSLRGPLAPLPETEDLNSRA